MKKIYLLFSVCVLLFSCSDDDNNDNVDRQKIIGKYYLFSTDDVEVDDCGKETYVDIKSDGTLVSEYFETDGDECISFDGETTYTYTIKNGKITIDNEETDDVEVISYKFVGDDLELTYEEDDKVFVDYYVKAE
ncbi:lipocalin family protein [Flavobacterium sp. FZUC8N2.13]|uniref:Lipocalin family protein n=1 Tax=Flavobacterium zubiriense TaxID=3138075 RepID=A0ABV4TGD8_9FLAO